MKEKKFNNKKKKLNLRIKKNSSEIKKSDDNLISSQCSVYLTQNLSEQLIQLPTILERINGLCQTELNLDINKTNNKNKTILPKKVKFTKIEINQPMKVLNLKKDWKKTKKIEKE